MRDRFSFDVVVQSTVTANPIPRRERFAEYWQAIECAESLYDSANDLWESIDILEVDHDYFDQEYPLRRWYIY